MLNTGSVGTRESTSSHPSIYPDLPACAPVVKGIGPSALIRSFVTRHPAVSALMAMVAGALAMAFVRNRVITRVVLHRSKKLRRGQIGTKRAS